jgi:hypothetical protein
VQALRRLAAQLTELTLHLRGQPTPTPPAILPRREAPAFTRRERHLHPTSRLRGQLEKPPRSRGGSVIFTLRRASAGNWRSPRVHAAGVSPSPYVPAPCRREASVPSQTRVSALGSGSPRVHAAGVSPSPYVPAPCRREASAPCKTRVSALWGSALQGRFPSGEEKGSHGLPDAIGSQVS